MRQAQSNLPVRFSRCAPIEGHGAEYLCRGTNITCDKPGCHREPRVMVNVAGIEEERCLLTVVSQHYQVLETCPPCRTLSQKPPVGGVSLCGQSAVTSRELPRDDQDQGADPKLCTDGLAPVRRAHAGPRVADLLVMHHRVIDGGRQPERLGREPAYGGQEVI